MAFLILVFAISDPLISNNTGAPMAVTGSPGDGGNTCAKSTCHTGSPVTVIPGIITSNVPPSGYTPGQVYTITATVGQSGITKYGFQISPQNNFGQLVGTLAITSPTTTKIVSSKYVTHTSGGTSAPSSTRSWSFNWTAPIAGTGNVTFYGAFNYTNSNGTSSGDQIHTSTLIVSEDITASVEIPESDGLIAYCYPVPVVNSFYIKLNAVENDLTSIHLIDITGKKVAVLFEGVLPNNGEAMQLTVPATLRSGIYFVSVETPRQTGVMRIIKL